MPIQHLLADGAFTPDEVANLVTAFEGCLRSLRLEDRNDPFTNLVAHRVLELAKTGPRDPLLLHDAVLQSFKNDPGTSGC